MNTPRQLWLVRHAQPLVEPGLCYGASDLEADPHDTQRAAQQLATVLPAGASLFMSGLRRAQQLAHALHLLRPDLGPPVCDARLNEMDFGQFELVRWDAIGKAEYDAWTADFCHFRFGGRESVGEMLARVKAALDEVQTGSTTTKSAQPGDCVWITHAGVIRSVRLLNAGADLDLTADQWPREAPAFGGWTSMDLSASR